MRPLGGNASTVSQTNDADGQLVKRTYTYAGNPPSNIYYLRSTVLGGKILTEYSHSGGWTKDYIYLGDEVIATKDATSVNWRHQDPLTGSRGESSIQGYYAQKVEPDPMGVDVGLADPWSFPPEAPHEPEIASLDPGFPTGRCRVEGMIFDCNQARRLFQEHNASECPNADCGPHLVTVTQSRNGKTIAESSYLAPQGDPAWDGSLDGTYGDGHKNELLKKFNLNDPADAALLVSRVPVYLELEMLARVGQGKPRYPRVEFLRDYVAFRNSYGSDAEAKIQKVVDGMMSDLCTKAFLAAGLTPPRLLLGTKGVVIGPASLLSDSSAQNLKYMGITEYARNRDVKYNSGEGGVRAFTINDHPGKVPDTVDGRPRIFLNNTAFGSLANDLIHEFIHAGGGEARDNGRFSSDLAHLGYTTQFVVVFGKAGLMMPVKTGTTEEDILKACQ